LRCSGQSGASVADEDISSVLGPGQVGPKLYIYDNVSLTHAAKSPFGESTTCALHVGNKSVIMSESN